jgi:hypothetical protein
MLCSVCVLLVDSMNGVWENHAHARSVEMVQVFDVPMFVAVPFSHIHQDWYLFTSQNSVTTQKTCIFSNVAVRSQIQQPSFSLLKKFWSLCFMAMCSELLLVAHRLVTVGRNVVNNNACCEQVYGMWSSHACDNGPQSVSTTARLSGWLGPALERLQFSHGKATPVQLCVQYRYALLNP